MKTDISGNLAVGKPTNMSSVSMKGYSWKAADGSRDNKHARDNCCAITAKQKGSWWQVDLQAVYLIREVAITKWANTYGELGCIADLVELDCPVTCR